MSPVPAVSPVLAVFPMAELHIAATETQQTLLLRTVDSNADCMQAWHARACSARTCMHLISRARGQ
jgi:hypothetical protein